MGAQPIIITISGPQGAGKSLIAAFLHRWLVRLGATTVESEIGKARDDVEIDFALVRSPIRIVTTNAGGCENGQRVVELIRANNREVDRRRAESNRADAAERRCEALLSLIEETPAERIDRLCREYGRGWHRKEG